MHGEAPEGSSSWSANWSADMTHRVGTARSHTDRSGCCHILCATPPHHRLARCNPPPPRLLPPHSPPPPPACCLQVESITDTTQGLLVAVSAGQELPKAELENLQKKRRLIRLE